MTQIAHWFGLSGRVPWGIAVLAMTCSSVATAAVITEDTPQDAALVQTVSEVDRKAFRILTRQTAPQTRVVSGQLIVKFKSDGPHAVTECAHCLLAQGRSFHSATADHSDSLDLLNQQHHITAAREVFFEREEGLSSAAAGMQSRLHVEAIKSRFSKRTRRAPRGAQTPDLTNVYVFKTSQDADIQEICRLYQQDPHVEYAHPNYLVQVQVAPNDPYYSSSGSWGQAYDDLWGLKKIKAEPAWDITQGSGIVVAVIDTGLDPTHPDIAANVWTNPGEVPGNMVDDDGNGYVDDVRGWDFANNDNDPRDGNGHGAHVSGTIAAIGDNNLGIIGVAPKATIMAVKGLSDSGNGSADGLAKAIMYAAANGADVLNNSWGCNSACPVVPVFEDAVRFAHGLDAVVVFAAGNSNDDIANRSPQNLPETIAVSAFDQNDQKTSFSNFGVIDVAAPGGGTTSPPPDYDPFRNILSLKASTCDPHCDPGLVVGANYLRQAGTSMAAPHAAGVAALVLAAHPEFSIEQVRQALRRGSDDVDVAGFDVRSGYGRLNAVKSVAESAPLAALITQPVPETVSGLEQVKIRGTADGPAFNTWRLEFGAGLAPSRWTAIASSAIPVVDGFLAAWDIRTVRDGLYTLRLVATSSSGQNYEDRHRVLIDQVAITEPDPTSLSFFPAGQTVTVLGTAAPVNFSKYTLKVKTSAGAILTNPTPAITLTNGGLQKVYDGVLGSWETTNVPADHYQLVLEVSLVSGPPIVEQSNVVVDPLLHPGWPKNLGLLGGGGLSLALVDHLDAADVNGDGQSDLIIGYGNTVRIYDHTGALLPGWPQTVDPAATGALIQMSPAVGDLTGDGSPEVVATNNQSQVFIWQANGALLPGWPKGMGGLINSLSIEDINGDGTPEVIAADWAGQVKVFNKNGTMLPGWPKLLDLAVSFRLLSPAAVGDMDGDGKQELALVNLVSPKNLYLLRFDGTILPGWPKAINPTAPSNTEYYSYPALGDLNGDGDLEVVIGSADGKVYAFHHDGTAVAGWPTATKLAAVNSPAIGDIDGDGRAEVIAGNQQLMSDSGNYLFAWKGDGTLLAGWPVKYDRPTSYSFFGFGAPALADLDGDGRADVIASSDASSSRQPFALNTYQYDGTKVSGFPRPTAAIGAWPTNTAAVADVDGDGALELAWIDFDANLYVWDLPGAASGSQPWPMFHHDARHTGGNIQIEEDHMAPAAVDDLTAGSEDLTRIKLMWTATGDDGLEGTASSYDLRYATSPITTEAAFQLATQVPSVPPPQPAGSPEQFTVTGLTPGTTYFFAMKVLDNRHNASPLSNQASAATKSGVAGLSEDFESGAPGWTMSGLWHLSKARAHSPQTSAAYNDGVDYDTGLRNSGALVSPPIALTNATEALLEFSHWYETESSAGAAFDVRRLELSMDGGISWQVLKQWDSRDPNQLAFTLFSFDLAPYLGETIQLRFFFDTVDGVSNRFEGWYVDDVKVSTASPTNQPPVLAPIGNQIGNEDQLLSFTLSAIDPDGDTPLDFSASNLPPGATFDKDDAAFAWTPDFNQAGAYPNVHFEVSDGQLTDSEDIAITVLNVNRPPELAPIGDKTVREGELLSFLVTASDPDDGDTLTYSFAGLPSGATFVGQTFSWAPGYDQAGTYPVTFMVSDGALTDEEEVLVTVQNVPIADLLLTDLATATTVIIPGKKLVLANTATNQGDLAAGSFVIAFHLSGDASFGGADDLVFNATRGVGSLGPGAGSAASTTLTVPSTTPLGRYYVCALADFGDTIREGDEANNARCTDSTLQVTRPDLVMTAVNGPAAATRGIPIGIANTVQNQGTVDSPRGFYVGLYLSKDAAITTSDRLLGRRLVNSLAAGASSSRTASVTVPSTVKPGTYYLGAIADPGGAVKELDESNNALAGNQILVR